MIRRLYILHFTLIELLVVVAIISILCSILLPGLKKAKDMAKTADCMNKQKQLALAITNYSSDYDDNLPPINMGHWQTGMSWADQIDPYLFGRTPSLEQAKKFYHCNAEYRGDKFTYSYAVNSQIDKFNNCYGIWSCYDEDPGTDVYIPPLVKITQLSDFSGTFMTTCYAWNSSWGGQYNWSNGISAKRPYVWDGSGDVFQFGLLHNRATTWSFCDGHVEWMRWQDSVGTGEGNNPKGIWTRKAGD